MNDESSGPPAVQHRESKQPHTYAQYKAAIWKRRIPISWSLVSGIVVGFFHHTITASIPAWSAVVAAFAALVAAWFAGKLSDTTDKLREVADAQRGLMNRQLDAIESQGKQIEREFLATHRPRVILRRITFEPDPPRPPGQAPGVPKIKIELVNDGGSDATISNLFISFKWFNPNYFRLSELIDEMARVDLGDKPFVLVPGEPIAVVRGMGGAADVIFHTVRAQQGFAVLYCLGRIEYTDAAKKTRRTGFIRTCDLQPRRFRRITDDTDLVKDFEYTD